MYRFIVALFLAFLSVADLSAKVYPDDGPLFDPSSPECAVGRPLSEVLDEIGAQTEFLKSSGETLQFSTSNEEYAGLFFYDITGESFSWPKLLDSDTLMFIKNVFSEKLNDTTIALGVYFTRGTDNTQRKVKNLWLEYSCNTEIDPVDATYDGVSHSQDYNYIEPYVNSTFITENILHGECPTPNHTYNITVDDSTYFCYWDRIRHEDNHYRFKVETATETASALSKCIYKKQFNHYKATIDYTSHYVGGIKYCPVFEDIYDTLCPTELPGKYNTRLTESGTETVYKGKTWYGSDSLVDLHLVVTDKCKKDRDFEEVIPDKFFTPNGDGLNDTWNIQNISQYENYVVCIYDRHGKLLMKYRGNFSGWNGIYNGNPQPSTDYWYTITIDESDEEFSGHFTLIR